MAENLQPQDMATWMRDIDRRLSATERASRITSVQYTAVTQPNVAVTVTSGTFVTVWEFALSLVVADSVSMMSIVDTAAATTCELRLTADLTGTPTFTDVNTLGANLQKRMRFDWLVPDLDLGRTGILIQMQARRASGSGNVLVYNPVIAMQLPSYEFNAEADGNPRVI